MSHRVNVSVFVSWVGLPTEGFPSYPSPRVTQIWIQIQQCLCALNLLPVSGSYTNSDMTEFEDLLALAKAGDAEAQCNPGIMYANGRWVRPNQVEAS